MPEWSCNGEKLVPYIVTWELVNGKPWPNGLIALHQCDNRRCCNPGHYHPGTVAQNNAEKELRERDNGMSHRDVRIVRVLLALAVKRKDIAQLMECSVSTINAIATKQNHKRTEDVELTGEVSIRGDGETLDGCSDTISRGGTGDMVSTIDGNVGIERDV